MALNIPLLRGSFELLAELEPDLAYRFYETLFSRYPQVATLFRRRDRRSQAKMLTEALVAVMGHLNDAPWLAATLAEMGAQHEEYGVTPEMYGWVSECLLGTLTDIAGDAWNDELASAWEEALDVISTLMLRGAS